MVLLPPRPLPLPTAVNGGGASFGADCCSVLLVLNMDPISIGFLSLV